MQIIILLEWMLISGTITTTPLILACRRGYGNIVRRLYQVTGIQLDSRNDDGQTALYLAVLDNSPACVSVLRGVTGVDWNVRDNNVILNS